MFLGPSSPPRIITFLREVYEKDEKHHILGLKRFEHLIFRIEPT